MGVTEIWTGVLAIASALVLLSNAAEKVAAAVRAAKAPNDNQNARLDALEEWRKEMELEHQNDHIKFEALESGNRVTQRALLALLDHGIDGNNVDQMQQAKAELQSHLINR